MIGPSDALALVELLDALPPAARLELFSRYCRGCGKIEDEDHPCQCWNDE